MAVELSGPPGGGKSAVAIGIMLGARLGKQYRESAHNGDHEGDDAGEILVVGELSLHLLQRRLHRAAR